MHEENLQTKKRLLRILDDYNARKAAILQRNEAAYSKKIEASKKKIEEEMGKRRMTVFKAREEQRLKEEEEEEERRREEEEERAREAGMHLNSTYIPRRSLTTSIQSAKQRRSVSNGKKQSVSPRKRKSKPRLPKMPELPVKHAKRSARRLSRRLVSSSSARRKPKPGAAPVQRSASGRSKPVAGHCSVALPLRRLRRRRMSGGAIPLRTPFLRPLAARPVAPQRRSSLKGLRARRLLLPLPSTGLVRLLEVEVDGERGWMRRRPRRRRVGVGRTVGRTPLRGQRAPLPPRRSLRGMTMGSLLLASPLEVLGGVVVPVAPEGASKCLPPTSRPHPGRRRC